MAATTLDAAPADRAPARARETPGTRAVPEAAPSRFHLVRFFTAASLVAFVLVGAAMILQERAQSSFFAATQERQGEFFGEVQQGFVKKQEQAALGDLLAIHESGNVNLTRLFANALWDRDFAPFAARAQAIAVEQCRAIADAEQGGKKVAPPEKKACFEDVRRQIMALPGFAELDAKVLATMKKTSVFKIKVFDLRGVTLYSSEHAQIGEDKLANAGWRAAAAGKAASELTHRDKFSAFEGVVENRDLISSYLPVLDPKGERIVGVFEIYSDVTPLLERIKVTTREIAANAAANQQRVSRVAAADRAEAEVESTRGLAIVFGLLAALFVALFLIVRRAHRIITSQEHEREQMQQQLGQNEKMAALGQMVAGVAHQLNTPIAFSHSNVSLVAERLGDFELPLKIASKLTEIARATPQDPVPLQLGRSRAEVESNQASPADVRVMRDMLRDVIKGMDQMSELVVNMREFTRLDRSSVADYDINHGLKTVVYMAKSVIPNEIRIIEDYGRVPPILCNPSQLNQVFLNLITNGAQAIQGGGKITVRTTGDGPNVRVDITDTGSGIPPDVLPHIFDSFYTTKPRGVGTGLGLSIAREIVQAHAGEIRVDTAVGRGTKFSIVLPVCSDKALEMAD